MFRFWNSAFKSASATSQAHFRTAFTNYLYSVVQQAADRDNDHHRTIEEYLENRRENIGAWPSFAILELALNLPDAVFYHPFIIELTTHVIDLLVLDNVSLGIVLWSRQLTDISRLFLGYCFI